MHQRKAGNSHLIVAGLGFCCKSISHMDNPWPDNREMMALIPTTVGSDVTGQGAQYPAAPNRMTGR